MAKILVIDDDPLARSLSERALKRAGHDAVTADNGEAGLRCFSEDDFDLVITDIFMPDCDGLEVIRGIAGTAPSTPILVISGGSKDIPEDYLRIAGLMGAHSTLAKPFTPEDLRYAVENLLTREPNTDFLSRTKTLGS